MKPLLAAPHSLPLTLARVSILVGIGPVLASACSADGARPSDDVDRIGERAEVASQGDPPALSVPEPTPGQVVEITTEDGVVLEGTWFAPPRGAGPSAAVLLLHDAGGSRTDLQLIAERLVRQKLGVLALDLRGHGGSRTKSLDWASLPEDRRTACWIQALRDLHAAVSWIAGRPGVDARRIGLVGYRAGCALALRKAVQDERIARVVLLDPPPKVHGYDVQTDLLRSDGLPVLVVASEGDHESSSRRMVEELRARGIRSIELRSSRREPLHEKRIHADLARFFSTPPARPASREEPGRDGPEAEGRSPAADDSSAGASSPAMDTCTTT